MCEPEYVVLAGVPAAAHPVGMTARMKLHAGGLIAAMVAGCLSIWTVSPLLWLWIGSQVDTTSTPSMTAIAVVVIGAGLTTVAIGYGLVELQRRYRTLDGSRGTVRLHLPWLRSMRGERMHERGDELELSVLDFILVISVIVALLLYNYWFLFLSDSPIDFRTGRE